MLYLKDERGCMLFLDKCPNSSSTEKVKTGVEIVFARTNTRRSESDHEAAVVFLKRFDMFDILGTILGPCSEHLPYVSVGSECN